MISFLIKVFFSFLFLYSCGPGFYINEGMYHDEGSGSNDQQCSYSSIASDAAFSYRLDENSLMVNDTVIDSSSNNEDGQIQSVDGTRESSIQGRFGNALDIDEAGVHIEQNSSISSPPTDSFTISFWFKHNGDISGSNREFYLDMSADASNKFRLAFNESGIGSNPGLFQIYAIAGGGSSGDLIFTGVNYFDRSWHHMVITKSNSSGVTVFVDNGQIAKDTSLANTSYTNWGAIFFGSDQARTLAKNFGGQLDEINFWIRELSLSEIQQLYECQPD